MFSDFGILYALLALSFLIFFHELGHFLAARFFKVRVEVFSIGFGKKILSKKIGETTYCISLVPLGGYVQMKGQNDTDPNEKSFDLDSYNTKAPWQRIIILLAGPFANLLLAFFIYLAVANLGVPALSPQIGTIVKDSPAYNTGLLEKDIVKEMNGQKIRHWNEIKPLISNSKGFIDILIQRDNETLNIKLLPKLGENKNIFGENIQEKLAGVAPTYEIIKVFYTGFDSLKYSFDKTIESSIFMFKSIQKLVTGVVSPKQLSGPIGIVEVSSKVSKKGLVQFLMLVALISVNLAVLNLLPIPALDGGHIMFNLYEILFKKPPNDQILSTLTFLGWVLLLVLMSYTTGNDISKLITKGSIFPS